MMEKEEKAGIGNFVGSRFAGFFRVFGVFRGSREEVGFFECDCD